MALAAKAAPEAGASAVVDELVRRARRAMEAFADADQARTDEAVVALAWALYKPEHARELAELAVADTGLGNVPDKVTKKQRKTFGTLRDLLRVKSVGVIEEDPTRGIVKYAKPVGVVAAVTPSTNPGATPVNKAMMAVKGRNAIVIAASPAGLRTTARTVELMRAELAKVGAPPDLVQILPPPASKDMTDALMQAADLVVATGSQDNVRRAYASGTPAIGVGTGNVPVIVDETADLDDAAQEDLRLQDLRQRHVVLLGERRGDRRCGLRAGDGRAGTRRRLSRLGGREGPDRARAVAGRAAEPDAHRARRRRARQRLRPAGGGNGKALLHGGGDRRRPRPSVLRARSCRWCSPCTGPATSRRPWRG